MNNLEYIPELEQYRIGKIYLSFFVNFQVSVAYFITPFNLYVLGGIDQQNYSLFSTPLHMH